ncbi:division/cell wall cluster transcriptional repressor MraZ [Candidatus Uhrbacteria bacterium]|nr:division/cell wall cluster transcriptional repressor MraZ [Candidatus Uhrbacteria bacterium]
MFIGEYHYTIDDKGRLSIPVGYRTELSKGAVVTRGLDRTLFLYPKKQWESLAAKIAALPLSQADTRAFARLMLAGAMEVTIDKSGRIVIPEYLRTYAGLNKKAVISGLYDRLEIWDEDAWNSYAAKTEATGDQIAERLAPLGL